MAYTYVTTYEILSIKARVVISIENIYVIKIKLQCLYIRLGFSYKCNTLMMNKEDSNKVSVSFIDLRVKYYVYR